MSFRIEYTENFRKEIKQLAKKYPSIKGDLSMLVRELRKNPTYGTPLGNNLYKIRMAITSKDRGKSGGARVITCILFKSERVLLAAIYDKADYSTVDEKVILTSLKDEGLVL